MKNFSASGPNNRALFALFSRQKKKRSRRWSPERLLSIHLFVQNREKLLDFTYNADIKRPLIGHATATKPLLLDSSPEGMDYWKKFFLFPLLPPPPRMIAESGSTETINMLIEFSRTLARIFLHFYSSWEKGPRRKLSYPRLPKMKTLLKV